MNLDNTIALFTKNAQASGQTTSIGARLNSFSLKLGNWFSTLEGQTAFVVLAVVIMLGLSLLNPAFAGSDTTFSGIVDWLINLLKGSGGLLIAIIALILGLISMVTGRAIAMLLCFAVAIFAVFGPDALKALFTATL